MSKKSLPLHHAALKGPGCLAICETIGAGLGSEGTHADSAHSNRDVSNIAAPREIFIVRSGSQGAPGASFGTCWDEPTFSRYCFCMLALPP